MLAKDLLTMCKQVYRYRVITCYLYTTRLSSQSINTEREKYIWCGVKLPKYLQTEQTLIHLS